MENFRISKGKHGFDQIDSSEPELYHKYFNFFDQ